MNDTTQEIDSRFREMIKRRTGEQRLKMGFSMYNMARSQVETSLKIKYPAIDINEMRRKIFLRFYGQDFSFEEQRKILKRLLK